MGWLAALGLVVVAAVAWVVFGRRSAAAFARAFFPAFARRLPVALVTLWFVATLVFLLTKAVGGEDIINEGRIDPVVQQKMMERYGLNDPLYVQYAKQMWQLVRLNTMPSRYQNARTMRDILGEHLPYTAGLGIRAIILAVLLGVPLGVATAVFHNRAVDQAGKVLALFGVSVPSFILASFAVYLLARKLRWFPAAEWTGPAAIWIPAACLAAFPFAAILRLTRASMLEALRMDYMRTARAKGVAEWRVILVHGLRNSLSAVVTYTGPMAAGLLTGSLVVEKIFSIPGIGDMFVVSVANRDMPLILGTTLFYSALLIVMNLLVDAFYPVLNPRLREG